jgi:very-short-patch-repair endonuclease
LKVDYDILGDIHLRIDGWRVRKFQAGEIQNSISGVLDEINGLL